MYRHNIMLTACITVTWTERMLHYLQIVPVSAVYTRHRPVTACCSCKIDTCMSGLRSINKYNPLLCLFVQNLFQNFSTKMENRKIDTWRDHATSPSLREVVAVGQGTKREEDESGGHGVDVRIHFLVWNIVKKSRANLTIVSYNDKSLKNALNNILFLLYTYILCKHILYIPTYVGLYI
jgi:hypothetical protein